VSKSGKPRYFFSKNPAQNTLEGIPTGYHIEESVNAVVSLVKDRKQLILPEEIQLVKSPLERHPKGNNYRVSAKGKQIIVYERLYSQQDIPDGMRTMLDKNAQYSPMLRFNLVNASSRTFCAERIMYVSSLPDWIDIGDCGLLKGLVKEIIPLLDSDEYFEL